MIDGIGTCLSCGNKIEEKYSVCVSPPTQPRTKYKNGVYPVVAYCVECFMSIAPRDLIDELQLDKCTTDNKYRCPECNEPLNEYNLTEGVKYCKIYECHSCHHFNTETVFNGIRESPIGKHVHY
jgi:hypothetical protein